MTVRYWLETEKVGRWPFRRTRFFICSEYSEMEVYSRKDAEDFIRHRGQRFEGPTIEERARQCQ